MDINQKNLLKLLKSVEPTKKYEKTLEELLEAIKQDKITNSKQLYNALHIFGEGKFYKAKKEIQKFLKHKDSSLRFIALNVLCFHLKLNYSKACIEFIKKDNDVDNKILAIDCLGYLNFGTKNKTMLKLLLKILKDSRHPIIIKATYDSIQDLFGILNEKKKRIDMQYNDFNLVKSQIDWDLIKSIEKEFSPKKKFKEVSK